jgi:rare lipoprotein A
MASLNRSCIGALLSFVFLMPLSLIQTHPLQAEELPNVEKEVQGGQTPVTEEAAGVKGLATYYAKRYNGRKTTSGERYRPEKLTAAHPTLPLGTKVRVVNLENENEVVVRVNDRCRKRKVPNIDLSSAAARKLGFLGRGMARVLITRLEDDPS